MKKAVFAASCLTLGLSVMAGLPPAYAEGGGPDQNVRIMTEPDGIDAHCLIDNAAGQEVASAVPAMLNIQKTTGKTRIACQSYDGIWSGNAIISPHADAWSVISGIPWLAFNSANDIGDDFSERGGASATAASLVRFKDIITIHMTKSVPDMPEAEAVPISEAIANAPVPYSQAPSSPAVKSTPHVTRHARPTYHPEPGHS